MMSSWSGCRPVDVQLNVQLKSLKNQGVSSWSSWFVFFSRARAQAQETHIFNWTNWTTGHGGAK
jgi:hypothetical protein